MESVFEVETSPEKANSPQAKRPTIAEKPPTDW